MTRDQPINLDQVASWQDPPLILFLGIDTRGSLAHRLFDRWATLLGRPWTLRGIDLPADTASETYHRLVANMAGNPAVHGAVVTAHKLRLYRACVADLSWQDSLVSLTHEVNALATNAGVIGYARDAIALTAVLPTLVQSSSADGLGHLQVLCLGSGGAATALLLALHLDAGGGADPRPRLDRPAHVTFADTNRQALRDLRAVGIRAGVDPSWLSLVHVPNPEDRDALLSGVRTPALVVNATGLGKDVPGSPVTDRARFGPDMLAWDLNYRGALSFLGQAATWGSPTLDGWDYFIAGWASALAAIAGTRFSGDLLAQFNQIAASDRPQPTI